MHWRNNTLEQLEGLNLGNPEDAPTNLVKRCMELYRTSISSFSIEDLRLMISQQIGLIYLIPLTIEKLGTNLFAEGNFYEGDLLQSVLNIEETYWHKHLGNYRSIQELIIDRLDELEERRITYLKFFTISIYN